MLNALTHTQIVFSVLCLPVGAGVEGVDEIRGPQIRVWVTVRVFKGPAIKTVCTALHSREKGLLMAHVEGGEWKCFCSGLCREDARGCGGSFR